MLSPTSESDDVELDENPVGLVTAFVSRAWSLVAYFEQCKWGKTQSHKPHGCRRRQPFVEKVTLKSYDTASKKGVPGRQVVAPVHSAVWPE
jgi:hypothetical protein